MSRGSEGAENVEYGDSERMVSSIESCFNGGIGRIMVILVVCYMNVNGLMQSNNKRLKMADFKRLKSITKSKN